MNSAHLSHRQVSFRTIAASSDNANGLEQGKVIEVKYNRFEIILRGKQATKYKRIFECIG